MAAEDFKELLLEVDCNLDSNFCDAKDFKKSGR